MLQRILIVDDSQPIHALVRARLADEPVEFLSAHDGNSAMRMAGEYQPDLILLDVDMPAPDGFEVCRFLKRSPDTLSIPVIFLTGAASTQEKIKGLELGAVDYVTKPFDPAELRARVRASLRTKYLMDLLAKKAMIDGLTGLWNRAYFEQRLAQEISASLRSSRPLGLVMMDVDHFKKINDTYGHPFGDEVLRWATQIMQEHCRMEDVICRFGGEEFAILTPGVNLVRAEAVAQRARMAIAESRIGRAGREIQVTCSFGVADNLTCGRLSLVEAADQALYQAKYSGRNRVVMVNEITSHAA